MSIVPTYSLAPFRNELKKADMLHLLRRCLFGVGQKEVAFFKDKKLNQCIDVLLSQSPPPAPLLEEDPDLTDPFVPKGQEWVNAPWENEYMDSRRRGTLEAWWVGQIINRDYSLTEKMTLFWHNHFVTEMDVVKDARYSYRYISMIRAHSLGNFKKLIREGTTNMAMLVYLNGNSNSKAAPNENYSRELMELFTLGKAGKSNYTEDDVKAGARVLSGWRDNKDTLEVKFHPELHDDEDKQFSSFFNNQVIKGKKSDDGATETDELIDMIFKKEETAQFVCRNLYRWFVSSHIDEHIEEQIITPLAKILKANNFEVVPVIKTLLSSEHFFDPAFRGCMVKNPADFFLGAMQQFDVSFPADSSKNHLSWVQIHFFTEGLTMNIGTPPSVAGWPAYYQAPKFHQWWINSATLGFRTKLMDNFSSPQGEPCNGSDIKIDFLHFVTQLENPDKADNLIDNCVELLYAVEISPAVKSKLKAALLPGQQTDEAWAEAWNKFMATPNDMKARGAMAEKLRPLFKKLVRLPEFQMI